MIPDPVAGPAVVRLFERRAAGASWSELARLLDLELPRADGATWRPSTVADMVTTPMYVGRLERTIGGERMVVDDAHEPLVSRALWETVVNGRQAARGPSRREQPAMLAGLVRCAGCGGPMSRGTGGQKRGADGKVRVYDAYVCLSRCDRPAKISVRLADNHVLGAVIDRLAASRAVGTARTPGDNELDALERALEHEEAEQAAFHRAVSVLDMGEAAYRRAAPGEARTGGRGTTATRCRGGARAGDRADARRAARAASRSRHARREAERPTSDRRRRGRRREVGPAGPRR